MSNWPPDPTMPGPPPMGGPGPGMPPPPGFPPDPGSGGFDPSYDPSGGFDPSYDPTMGGFGGPPPPPPSRSGLNPAIIVGVVLLVVAVVGGGALLLLGGDDDDDSENAANRRDRQGQQEGSEDCPSLEVPGPSSDGSASMRSQEGDGDGTSGGLPGGATVPEIPEGCIPDVDVSVPEVPDETDLTVPTVPDVTIEDEPVTPPSDSTSGGGVSDVLAESIYSSTPPSIDSDTAYCIADVIIGVVGESQVESAGGTWDQVYDGTSPEQDTAIASGIYDGCTTSEQDTELAGDPDWPDAWATG